MTGIANAPDFKDKHQEAKNAEETLAQVEQELEETLEESEQLQKEGE